MPQFEITHEFEAFCKCGEGMCSYVEVSSTHKRREPCIVITPCDVCLDRAREEAREEGIDEGRRQMQEEIDERESTRREPGSEMVQ
jgi:hypothetical protein